MLLPFFITDLVKILVANANAKSLPKFVTKLGQNGWSEAEFAEGGHFALIWWQIGAKRERTFATNIYPNRREKLVRARGMKN